MTNTGEPEQSGIIDLAAATNVLWAIQGRGTTTTEFQVLLSFF